jgi:hypothetical protein
MAEIRLERLGVERVAYSAALAAAAVNGLAVGRRDTGDRLGGQWNTL